MDTYEEQLAAAKNFSSKAPSQTALSKMDFDEQPVALVDDSGQLLDGSAQDTSDQQHSRIEWRPETRQVLDHTASSGFQPVAQELEDNDQEKREKDEGVEASLSPSESAVGPEDVYNDVSEVIGQKGSASHPRSKAQRGKQAFQLSFGQSTPIQSSKQNAGGSAKDNVNNFGNGMGHSQADMKLLILDSGSIVAEEVDDARGQGQTRLQPLTPDRGAYEDAEKESNRQSLATTVQYDGQTKIRRSKISSRSIIEQEENKEEVGAYSVPPDDGQNGRSSVLSPIAIDPRRDKHLGLSAFVQNAAQKTFHEAFEPESRPFTRQTPTRHSQDQHNQSYTVFVANRATATNQPLSPTNHIQASRPDAASSRKSEMYGVSHGGAPLEANAVHHRRQKLAIMHGKARSSRHFEDISASSHSHYKIVNQAEQQQPSSRLQSSRSHTAVGASQRQSRRRLGTPVQDPLDGRFEEVTQQSVSQTLGEGRGDWRVNVQDTSGNVLQSLQRDDESEAADIEEDEHSRAASRRETSQGEQNFWRTMAMQHESDLGHADVHLGGVGREATRLVNAPVPVADAGPLLSKSITHAHLGRRKKGLDLNLSSIQPSLLVDSLDKDSMAQHFVRQSMEKQRQLTLESVSAIPSGRPTARDLGRSSGRPGLRIHATATLATSMKERQILKWDNGQGEPSKSGWSFKKQQMEKADEANEGRDEVEDEADVQISEADSTPLENRQNAVDTPSRELDEGRDRIRTFQATPGEEGRLRQPVRAYDSDEADQWESQRRSRVKMQKSNSVDLFSKKNGRRPAQEAMIPSIFKKDKLAIQSTRVMSFRNQNPTSTTYRGGTKQRGDEYRDARGDAFQAQALGALWTGMPRHQSQETTGRWNAMHSKMKNSVFSKQNLVRSGPNPRMRSSNPGKRGQLLTGLDHAPRNDPDLLDRSPYNQIQSKRSLYTGRGYPRRTIDLSHFDRAIGSARQTQLIKSSAPFPDVSSYLQSTDQATPIQNAPSNTTTRPLHHSLNYLLQPKEKFAALRAKVQRQLDPRLRELTRRLLAQLSHSENGSVRLSSMVAFFQRLGLLETAEDEEERLFATDEAPGLNTEEEEHASQIQMHRRFLCSNIQTLLFSEGETWVKADLLQDFIEGLLWQGQKQEELDSRDGPQAKKVGKSLLARANCAVPSCSNLDDTDGVLGVRFEDGREMQSKFRIVNEDEQLQSDKQLYLLWVVQQAKRSKREESARSEPYDQDKFLVLDLEAQLVGSVCWMFDRIQSQEPLEPGLLLESHARSPHPAKASPSFGLSNPLLPSELVTVPVDGVRSSSKVLLNGGAEAQDANARSTDPDVEQRPFLGKGMSQEPALGRERPMSRKVVEFRRIFEEYQSIRSFYQKKNQVSADQTEFELQQSILLDLTDVIEDHLLRQVQTQMRNEGPVKSAEMRDMVAGSPDGHFQSLLGPQRSDLAAQKVATGSPENLDLAQLESAEREVLGVTAAQPVGPTGQQTADALEPALLVMSPQRQPGDPDISVYISLTSQQKIQSSHIRSIAGMTSQGENHQRSVEAESAKPTVAANKPGNIKDQEITISQTNESPCTPGRGEETPSRRQPQISSPEVAGQLGTDQALQQTERIHLFPQARSAETDDGPKGGQTSREMTREKLSARSRNKVFESSSLKKKSLLHQHYLDPSQSPGSPHQRKGRLGDLNSSSDSRLEPRISEQPSNSRGAQASRLSPTDSRAGTALDQSMDLKKLGPGSPAQVPAQAVNQQISQEEGASSKGKKKDRSSKGSLNKSQSIQTLSQGLRTVSIYLGSVNSKRQNPPLEVSSQLSKTTSQRSIEPSSQHTYNQGLSASRTDLAEGNDVGKPPPTPSPVPTIGAVSPVAGAAKTLKTLKTKKRKAANIQVTSTQSLVSQPSLTSSSKKVAQVKARRSLQAPTTKSKEPKKKPAAKKLPAAAQPQSASSSSTKPPIGKDRNHPTVPGVQLTIDKTKKKVVLGKKSRQVSDSSVADLNQTDKSREEPSVDNTYMDDSQMDGESIQQQRT